MRSAEGLKRSEVEWSFSGEVEWREVVKRGVGQFGTILLQGRQRGKGRTRRYFLAIYDATFIGLVLRK